MIILSQKFTIFGASIYHNFIMVKIPLRFRRKIQAERAASGVAAPSEKKPAKKSASVKPSKSE